jgi:hypothetical protein
MKKNIVALRLRPSLLEEVRCLANEKGVAMSQFINVAVAEKVSASRTESLFRERGARGDPVRAVAILQRAGVDKQPRKGDEIT